MFDNFSYTFKEYFQKQSFKTSHSNILSCFFKLLRINFNLSFINTYKCVSPLSAVLLFIDNKVDVKEN